MSGLHLTFDIDWAPDVVLEDLERLLSHVSVPVTLFCTHKSAAINRLCRRAGTEMAVHPNFMKTPSEPVRLKEVLKLFPGAKGVRNHWLYYHYGLLDLFHRAGMEYLSNDLMFLRPRLEPYFDWTGLVRLPIFWDDEVHLNYFDNRFELSELGLSEPGLKIFSFTPIHIYLNSRSPADYEQKKLLLKDPLQAARLREEGKGIRSLFLDFLAHIKSVPSSTLFELTREFKEKNPYKGNFRFTPDEK